MSLMTQKEIQDYLQTFSNAPEITFTKEVVNAIGLDSRQIYLKLSGSNYPCIIYSCGLRSAKIVVNLKEVNTSILNDTKALTNLRFYFNDPSRSNPVTFFIACHITGWSTYNTNNQNLYFISLEYNNIPPNELVAIIGEILDANEGFKRRKEERITIDPISVKRLGLRSKVTVAKFKENVIKCVLRDISLSGTQLITTKINNIDVGDSVSVCYDFERLAKPIVLKGQIVRIHELQDHTFSAISTHYEEPNIPIEYKIALNDYLKHKNFATQGKKDG